MTKKYIHISNNIFLEVSLFSLIVWKCFCRQNARWDFTGIIILIRTVSRLKLIKMSSPSWSSRNDSYVDTSCTMDLRNYRRHPSWVTTSSRAEVQCATRVSLVYNDVRLSKPLPSLQHLNACLIVLTVFPKVSILVRILLLFNNSLGDSLDAKGIVLYCIRNSCKASFGGNEDFLNVCLNDCIKRSAAPIVAG